MRRLLVPLAIAVTAACAPRQQDRKASDTLLVALESSPLRLDPRVGTDQASWRVHDVVYNGLLKKAPGGEFVPDLAESCTTEDARSWKVTLRDGVRFHDGRSVTADDVAYTYESLLEPGFVSSKREPLRIIERIEKVSPRELVFHLSAPYASFPLQLLLGIVPNGVSPAEADARPIGTGPYRVLEVRPDDRIVFERWDGYYREKARLKRLIYRVLPDATTRSLEMLRGSLDLTINNIPPDLLPRLREAGVGVTTLPGANYAYLAFNFRDPVLGKKEVRQALALALDRDSIVEGLWRGTVDKTETLLPPGHWARADDLPPLTRDLAAARRLLDAAGYPDPGDGRPRLSLTYKTSTDEGSVLQATAIAAQWREAGVETRIRSNDFAVFYADVVKGAFQLYALRWQGIVDPDHYHEVFLSTSVPPKAWNRGFFSDPDVDRWIEEGRTALPREVRRPLYRKIQERVAEELPYISLYTMKTVAVHAPDLTNLEAIPQNGDFTFLPEVGRR